jgi:hypothetical protein
MLVYILHFRRDFKVMPVKYLIPIAQINLFSSQEVRTFFLIDSIPKSFLGKCHSFGF